MSPQTVTVIKSEDVTTPLEVVWRDIQRTAPAFASPFYHPAYTHAIAGVRDDVRIAVVKQGSDVTAIFPFHRDASGLAISVGDHLTDYQGPISRDPCLMTSQEFLEACGISQYKFDHLPAANRSFFFAEAFPDGQSPLMDVGANLRDYEARLAAARGRRSFWLVKSSRNRRRLKDALGRLEFEFDCRNLDLFHAAVALKSRQYERTEGWSAFTPWAVEALRRIFQTKLPDFRGMLSVLRSGDRVIAAHFGMRCNAVLHWWFPTYEYSLRDFSPGMVMLATIVEEAPSLGIKIIDLGKGDEAYKRRLMTRTIPLFRGIVVNPQQN